MSEQKWEYCELGLDGSKQHKPGVFGGKEGWSYDCHIRYYATSGSTFLQLATPDDVLPFNPFVKAMSLLGSYGWELVSVQHGNVETHTAGWPTKEVDGHIVWSRKVAYFKRPMVTGRAVDEPKLAL